MNRLDIMNPLHCILAQLWWQRVTSQSLHMRLSLYIHRGFSCGILMDFLVHLLRPPAAVCSYELLNQAWRLVFLERRQPRKHNRTWLETGAVAALAGCPSLSLTVR